MTKICRISRDFTKSTSLTDISSISKYIGKGRSGMWEDDLQI